LTRRVIAAALLIPACWFAWQWMFPSDEAQIRQLLTRVADAIGNDGTDAGNIEGLAQVAALQNDFAVDATVDAGEPFQRLTGRQAIVSAAAKIRVAVRNLEIRFPDVSVDVAEGGEHATALVTAEARFDDDGGRGIDARELEMSFTRVDGRWVIASVTLVQPLKRLQ
jgi:hypothetical protein